MKKTITQLLVFLTLPFYSQHLYFEQSNGTDATFGTVDVVEQLTESLTPDIIDNTTFDKTEGWELVAVDGSVYYYQITDQTSNNYGQIDYWDALTNTKTNYGNLSDIFDDPTFWTLGGADDGKLYFASGISNSEIVSWDGSDITHFAYLNDFLAAPAFWKLAGFYNGEMYVEWTNDSDFYVSVKAYDGNSVTEEYDNTDFYSNYDDAYLIGVTDYIIHDNTPLLSSLELIKDYVNGNVSLSTAEIAEIQSSLETNVTLLETDYSSMELAFEIIELYDAKFGGLFTTGTTTEGGYSRTDSGYEFENMILQLMQAVFNYSYTEENIEAYPNLFNNYLFETSSYFPGAVDAPNDSSISHDIQVNGTHLRNWGSQDNYYTMDARKPTGCYVAPGSIVTVLVPDALVGVGASVLVGAHTWNFSIKPTIKRMDQVTLLYEINDNEITIANPLGGGIYFNIPLGVDLGTLDVKITNAVRSPYYANTAIKQTTLDEWQNTERNYTAPWTDFETERTMIQMPTSWVYALDDPSIALQDWDDAMDAISTIHGRPLVRSKTAQYLQVDLLIRSANFSPGYPMVNHTYDPYNTHEDGNFSTHSFLAGPTSYVNNIDVVYHEMGHGERIPKFTGEIESYVNFLWVAVQNRAFGMELNEALKTSRNYSYGHSVDEAAVSWMVAENFRTGNIMSYTTGDNQQEFHYQFRGHAKYVDIVRLFGWDPIIDFYTSVSEDYEEGITYLPNLDPTDSRILRMSEAAGYDLRPLIHFWGIHPLAPEELASSIEASEVKQSTAIYDVINYYKTLIPLNNEEFHTFALNDFTETQILSATYNEDLIPKSYFPDFINAWWEVYDDTSGELAVQVIQDIIDLYFPDGRPEIDNNSCSQLEYTVEEFSSYQTDSTHIADNVFDGDPNTRWSAQGDGEYITLDLGDLYNVCDIEINFLSADTRSTYFDIEVSRDNLTYAPVIKNITSTISSELFDNYSVSRTARYIKITGHGNSENEWNSIEEISVYKTDLEDITLSSINLEMEENNNIELYPIPTKDILNISGLTNENTKGAIYDLKGRLINNFNITGNTLDTSTLTDGIYFLILKSEYKNSIKKFMIKK